MSLEKRIRDELHDTAERLALDAGEYQRTLARGAARKRRRIALLGGGLLGLIAVVVAGNALVDARAPTPVGAGETSDTTAAPVPDPTTPSSPPPTNQPTSSFTDGIAVASAEGIVVIDSNGETQRIESDHYYRAISSVISDGAGGLLFTHETTPLPWEQGALMHLPAGESRPLPLVAPAGGGFITPLAVENGSVFYRLDDPAGQTSIRAVGLDGAGERLIIEPRLLIAAAVNEGRIALAWGGDCGGYALFTTAGAALDLPAWAAACPSGVTNDIALAGDYLFSLEDTAGARQLVRIEWQTGARVPVPVVDAWQVEAASPQRVAVGGTRVQVGDFSGAQFVEIYSFDAEPGAFALVSELRMAAGAHLGSGMSELPCTPLDLPDPEPPAGLPEPVVEKFLQVFRLARDCEMEALAEVVVAEGAAYTFGGEADPVQTWVRSARHGYDVMSLAVRLLNVPPAFDQGIYAWPGVHLTNSEEDWQQLGGILSAAEFEPLYSLRDAGYLGLRIGIAEDGRLAYLIAGD